MEKNQGLFGRIGQCIPPKENHPKQWTDFDLWCMILRELKEINQKLGVITSSAQSKSEEVELH